MFKKILLSTFMTVTLTLGAFQLFASNPQNARECFDRCWDNYGSCLGSGDFMHVCEYELMDCEQECDEDFPY